MSDKNLFDAVHNPDVLSCLANLSNDEVFTPPEIANQMIDMLPQELFKDPKTKFLDPACKSGVFLREIAKRLIIGLEEKMPNLQERLDHIFHKQLFGIAITELTSLLSRRGLYCSKYPNGKYSVSKFDNAEGNIKFKKTKHTFKNKKCIYCGASQVEYDRDDVLEQHAYEFIHTIKLEEVFNMKFDVIIGNPPYQLNDGGGTGSSAIPIYQHFIEKAIKLEPRYLTMIIPSRWYAGGKGLDEFRKMMLNSKKIKKLVDFSNSSDCFKNVTIAGGINYFLWDEKYNGDCEVVNYKENSQTTFVKRRLNEFDVFVRDNIAINIIRKVKALNEKTMNDLVFSRNAFSISSNEYGTAEKSNFSDIILYSLKGKSFIAKGRFTDRNNLVDKYKVIMSKAMSGGNKPSSEGNYLVISSTMRVLNKGEICTETYLCIGGYETYEKADNLSKYLRTKFFRFLLLQCLSSINISKEKFLFIPQQNFYKPWTDEELYLKYKLSDEEIEFIETTIKPMDNGEINE